MGAQASKRLAQVCRAEGLQVSDLAICCRTSMVPLKSAPAFVSAFRPAMEVAM